MPYNRMPAGIGSDKLQQHNIACEAVRGRYRSAGALEADIVHDLYQSVVMLRALELKFIQATLGMNDALTREYHIDDLPTSQRTGRNILSKSLSWKVLK